MLSHLLDDVQSRGTADPHEEVKYSTGAPAGTAADDSEICLECDECLEFTVDPTAPYVPTDQMRRTVADRLLADKRPDLDLLHEPGNGGTKIKSNLGSLFHALCGDFYECGSPGCGCNRMENPMCRRRYRQIVVQRTEEHCRSVARNQPLRVVTLGSGALLTDFEVLLGLWARGVRLG